MKFVNVNIPKLGSPVYEIYFDERECKCKIRKSEVVSVTVFYRIFLIETQYSNFNRLGETVFATKAQAEKAIEERTKEK